MKNKQNNIITSFDDRDLPINTLSVEETERIEKIAMPLLKEALEKLRFEKPRLFKSQTPQNILDI